MTDSHLRYNLNRALESVLDHDARVSKEFGGQRWPGAKAEVLEHETGALVVKVVADGAEGFAPIPPALINKPKDRPLAPADCSDAVAAATAAAWQQTQPVQPETK